MDIKLIREKTAENLAKKRIVMVEGRIEDQTSVFIQNTLLDLDRKNNRPIFLFFYSPGGEGDSCLVIHDTLQGLSSPTIGITGFAGSAAGVILMGCSKRLILKSGKILIHSPGLNPGRIRLDEDFDERIRSHKEAGLVIKKRCQEIFLERSKLDKKSLDEVYRKGDKFEEWIYARQALKFGLVDRIIGQDDKLFEQIK